MEDMKIWWKRLRTNITNSKKKMLKLKKKLNNMFQLRLLNLYKKKRKRLLNLKRNNKLFRQFLLKNKRKKQKNPLKIMKNRITISISKNQETKKDQKLAAIHVDNKNNQLLMNQYWRKKKD